MRYNSKERLWETSNGNFKNQIDAWLTEKNGMLNEEYQFPVFPTQSELDLPSYRDRLIDLLKETTTGIAELNTLSDKSYDSYYMPYCLLLEKVSSFIFPLTHLKSVNSNPELEQTYEDVLPIISDYYSSLSQNENIFSAIEEVYANTDDEKRKEIIKEEINSYKRSGIGLDITTKNRLKNISAELSQLSNQYSKNVLEATNSFSIICNEEDVSEMPNDLKNIARCDEGYKFTLHAPSFSAYMKYGTNREYREQLYSKYITRASETNEEIIEKILQLKHEKAILLGFNNYAELSLETKMAEDSSKVISFLEKLGTMAKPMAELEIKELKDYNSDLKPYDMSYYTNKLLKEKYSFDVNKYKPYFELNNCVNGLFSVLYRMFDLVFKKVETQTWDPTVEAYDVYRHDMKMSRVYLDLQNRKTKRPGAWMNNSQSRYVNENGTVQLPVAYIVCNFTPALKDQPSLLTPYEVVTLFHEMGHVLQHICYEGNEYSTSGINGIEWDAVEWSSQFLESFVYNKEVLQMFAKHYKTGNDLPEEMIDKMVENKNFQSAMQLIRQSIFSLFDMNIYTKEGLTKEEVQTELTNLRNRYAVTETYEGNKFQTAFSHIFSGGYSAGYYSYKWAEALSSDCYLQFEKNVFDKDLCNKYYQTFLSRGSEDKSLIMFKNFMGRDLREESLLEYLGIK